MTRNGDGLESDAVAALVGRMKAEPSRTWSVIVTFLGDAIVPRGGSVWLGSLLALFEALDVNAPVVRTTVSRLTADDWLSRTRIGRNSFYGFSKRGAAEFEKAAERVYARIDEDQGGALSFALLRSNGDRDAARATLERNGFAQLSGDLWMSARDAPSFDADVIRFSGQAALAEGRALAHACWPLDDLAERYRLFLRAFSALDEVLARPRDIDGRDAMVARTLLVHEYRRVVLRDPLLPRFLLPAGWPAKEAALLCARLYEKLLSGSEAWLDDHGRCENGPLPPADATLTARFRSPVPPSIHNKNS